MPSDSEIALEGTVDDVLPGGKFKVRLDNNTADGSSNVVTAHLSGKMRINSIKIVMGDRVALGVSPYDLTKGRILRRLK